MRQFQIQFDATARRWHVLTGASPEDGSVLVTLHYSAETEAECEKWLRESRDKAAREVIEDLVCQFAPYNGGYVTGGLSALEAAFDYLGWTEPRRVHEVECDEPGCKVLATCGWSSKGGYRRTCYQHS